ncbi:protein bangles and beads [Drosophila grimshawi]|uniref:GH12548 n=1 Tax=Drosophila grimshawi TaxID=7222 RepID=B4JJV7_DROGR|nr:protein bangles and beads [Drosophila grimshawi]EDV99859.1 GH12548 [Drosophila grimshawi]
MNYYIFVTAAACMASILALPLPDEEVAIQPYAIKNEKLFVKTIQTSPIYLIPERKAIDKAEVVTERTAFHPVNRKPNNGYASIEHKLSAPDVETAPAIPATRAAIQTEVDKKLENQDSKNSLGKVEPIGAPKGIPLVDAPAPSSKMQNQIVTKSNSNPLQATAVENQFAAIGFEDQFDPSSAESHDIETEEVSAEQHAPHQERINFEEKNDFTLKEGKSENNIHLIAPEHTKITDNSEEAQLSEDGTTFDIADDVPYLHFSTINSEYDSKNSPRDHFGERLKIPTSVGIAPLPQTVM